MISKSTFNEQVGNGTFSANVELKLFVGNDCYLLGQLGPGFAYLANAEPIAASEGVIESIVDGDSVRQHVRFTSPIDGDSKRIEFRVIPSSESGN